MFRRFGGGLLCSDAKQPKIAGADTMRLRRVRLVSYAVRPRTPRGNDTLLWRGSDIRRAKFEWSAHFFRGTLPLLSS